MDNVERKYYLELSSTDFQFFVRTVVFTSSCSNDGNCLMLKVL